MSNDGKDRGRHRLANSLKASQVKVGARSEVGHVALKNGYLAEIQDE